jgi:phosphopantothenoylcysteine synthetase/decarboxylase
MKLLVTAGNTMVLIDRVRCLTNIFTGRTGAAIAACAYQRGHDVTLLTSHPEVAAELGIPSDQRSHVFSFRTFTELQGLMADRIAMRKLDAVIHCAAVSDYRVDGVYAPDEGTRFDAEARAWTETGGQAARLVDRSAGKVKSVDPELWLRLVRTPKLVDFIRTKWAFDGVLVKFKLEVGLGDLQLVEAAEKARIASSADLVVANTLEERTKWAWLGPVRGDYLKVGREDLPGHLLEQVERIHEERRHG